MISATMARAIQESSFSELRAVGSRSPETAKSFAMAHQIPVFYSDFQSVLDDPEVDVVYIGLPNHVHKEWVIRCAEAGKHILCEKPFATCIDDAAASLAAVEANGVFCMEALMYRCHPLISRLQDVMSKQVLGKIKLFTAVYTADIVNLANPIAGGAILNLGCYPVSLIRLLAGVSLGRKIAEPVEIASIGRMHANHNDTQAGLMMKFENESMAVVTTADDISMHASFEIIGTEGNLRFDTNPWLPEQRNNRFIIHQYKTGEAAEVNVTADLSLYAYQIDTVSCHILQGAKQCSSVSWQDTLGNMRVLDTWRRSVINSNPINKNITELTD